MKTEQTLNKAEQINIRTLAQLYAEPLDRWTPAELDYHVKAAVLRRLPVEALKRIAGTASENEARELYARYGG